jgi:hypothetical protein
MNTAPFSWWIAFTVFIFYVVVDALYVLYTKFIVEKKAHSGAMVGFIMYGLFAYGTIQYTNNHLYVAPVMIGSWLGTYLTIKYIK